MEDSCVYYMIVFCMVLNVVTLHKYKVFACLLPVAKVLETPSLFMDYPIQFVTINFGWFVIYF